MSDPPLDLGFAEPGVVFESPTQNARVLTEMWAAAQLFCPNCEAPRLSAHPPNAKVADLYCETCGEDFELKSTKGRFGAKVVDGAYAAMTERLASLRNPNLALMRYDLARFGVTDLFLVPKHFFTPAEIERRKPLAATARRAGWLVALCA